ncbi:MAG: hypothetical protein GY946_33350 [bacterium]|nr:hypothetical protein [bacterium]
MLPVVAATAAVLLFLLVGSATLDEGARGPNAPAVSEPDPEAPPSENAPTEDIARPEAGEDANPPEPQTPDSIPAEEDTSPPPTDTVPPEPAPSAIPAMDTEVAPALRRTPEQPEKPEEPFHRRGGLFNLALGVGTCGQSLCAESLAAAMARAEFGYRWGHLALVLSAAAGGGPIDTGGLNGNLAFYDIGAALVVYPVDSGRVDPFVGLGLGNQRVTEKTDDASGITKFWFSRGGVRPSAGILFYAGQRVALGPRFDIVMGFGGEVCVRFPMSSKVCSDISDLKEEMDGKLEKRALVKDLPKPWSLALDLSVVF